MTIFSWVLAAVGVALAAFAAYHSWRKIEVSIALLATVALYEVALLAQLITFASALGQRSVEPVILIIYLVACLVIPIAALLWGLPDKSRWGPGVIAIGMVAVAVMCVRVGQIWFEAPVAIGG